MFGNIKYVNGKLNQRIKIRKKVLQELLGEIIVENDIEKCYGGFG